MIGPSKLVIGKGSFHTCFLFFFFFVTVGSTTLQHVGSFAKFVFNMGLTLNPLITHLNRKIMAPPQCGFVLFELDPH